MGTLVTGIYIENFRSFRKSWFEIEGNTVPILGLNSAGKSNILRALDLFFNDSVDGRPIDFTRDLSGHLPSKTKKKIGVGVHLNYPNSFGLKGNRAFLENNRLGEQIAIYKEWTLTPAGALQCETTFGSDIEKLSRPKTNGDEAALFALIRSIKYHYISNHIRPADKVADILESLKPEIMKTWKNTYKQSGDFLEHLTSAANQMFEPVSKSVSKGISGLEISAAVPQDIGDLAFDLGMNAIAGTNVIHDLSQEGSGAQAFTLLHFLDLQDNAARKRSFGWVQASIWGIEEPESFLHAGLRSRFSSDLQGYSQTERRQVILTTHDGDFVRSAPKAVVVSAQPTGSQVSVTTSRDALERATKLRITAYRHPLVTHADDPLVIVEGKTDKTYLSAAIRRAGIRPRWRLVSPDEDLEPDSSGDALLNYLRVNKSALAARPDRAFVLALKDWEDAGKSGPLNKALSVHPFSKTIVCPAALCNPELGQKFVGIERFLPTSEILSIADPAHLAKGVADDVYGIDKTHLNDIKKLLESSALNGSDVGDHMEQLVRWVDEQVNNVLKEIPIDQFI